MTELAPAGMIRGMIQTRSCTLCHCSPCRTQATAAPAATLCPRIARAPPSKVTMEGVSRPNVPRFPAASVGTVTSSPAVTARRGKS
eukprot:50691-Lingulodinium_polyedra.AAC.1